MEKLQRIVEESALKAMMVDQTDLQGLADLHTHLQSIAKCAGELTGSSAASLQMAHPASAAAADLIEKIILQEVKDTEGTLNTIRETVQTLQKLIGQVAGGGSGSNIVFPTGLSLPQTESKGNQAAPQKKSVGGIALPDNVDEAILREFLTTQPDVLASLEAAILTTEQNPTKQNRNAIKGILHNLKGESALLGLQEMSSVCHRTESLLVDESKPIPVEQLLAAKDWLQKAVASLNQQTNSAPEAQEEKPLFDEPTPSPTSQEAAAAPAGDVNTGDLTVAEGDVPLAMEFVQESNEHLESAEANLLKIDENNSDTETLNAIFRAFHTIKGVAGFLNLKPIGTLAHAAENLLDLARKGKVILEGERTDVVFESIDAMKKMIHSLGESLGKDRKWQAYEKLEDLIRHLKILAGIDVTAAPAAPRPVAAARTEPPKATTTAFKEAAPGANAGGAAAVTAESTVKVTTARMDTLINTVGELVIAQSMVSQDITSSFSQNPRLERNVRHLDKITRSLQELSMSMRMVPVHGVFQKMARLVRDLSRKAGKEIELTCTGSETEMDRNVVEAIGDPLVHMVRNSVDHGVEPPDEREKAGKPRCGHVELKAFHQGGNVVIRITDDGRGLNRERLVQKAIDQGIIKSGQELSDQEIDRLIFHAGLSTAQKVTDISGRGVGMDVVRKNIEMLRGRIDIDSTWGKGTIFTIRLPLTLAVIDGQIARVGQEKFIVPIISIEQSLRPRREQISTVRGQVEMVMIRGSLLPLIRLHRLFHIQPQSQDPCESLVMVVGDGNERYCLLVDDLLGQQQVVIKSLGNYFESIPGVSGSAIMGDGLVRLILDIPGLLQAAQQNA